MANPSARDVALDAEWLPHTYDAGGGNLIFVHVPPEARAELMFLSDEHYAGKFRKAAFPAAAIAAEVESASRAPLHFVFHTSFCCSTLLARALDVEGVSNTLREPDVLINLGNRLIASDDQANRQRLELVIRLLERPAAPGEAVIVKPSNFANRLVDLILAQRTETRAVLLYSDVGTYLRSLLKRGMFGRIFGRKLFNQMSGWSPLKFGYSPSELFEQTDVQIAALGWLMQIHHFDAIARAFGPQRVMLLDSATLLADPHGSLRRSAALFGLDLDEERISKIVIGPAFSKHSKFSERDYGAEARKKDHDAVMDAHSEELGMVVNWIEAVAAQLGVPLKPGS
ncbi:MAG TPA: hypothetical protein VFO51_01400 [Sphingomicrobium sp.]|nr:hypothetical protein [Sphingomicrobium sp.]